MVLIIFLSSAGEPVHLVQKSTGMEFWIIQKDTKVEGCAEVVVITEKVREGDFRTAIEELRNRDSVRKISTIIRVYGK